MHAVIARQGTIDRRRVRLHGKDRELAITHRPAARTRAGKNRFESIRIYSVWRIELVFFDSVQFDYTIHISDITMFGK